MTFDELPEYQRDLKTLLKKYRTLSDDLNIVRKVLDILPDERPPFSYRIEVGICIIKVKKIACKALKPGRKLGLDAWFSYEQKITWRVTD